MMPLAELKDKVKKQLKIDRSNLASAAANNCFLVAEYIDLLLDVQKAYDKLQREYDVMYAEKSIYYKENGYKKFNLNTVGDMKMALSADADLQTLKKQLTERERLASWLQNVIDNFKARGFNIKNIIEILKFLQGD
jgi:DNA-binding transcriptional regulator YhcF (GntR family)